MIQWQKDFSQLGTNDMNKRLLSSFFPTNRPCSHYCPPTLTNEGATVANIVLGNLLHMDFHDQNIQLQQKTIKKNSQRFTDLLPVWMSYFYDWFICTSRPGKHLFVHFPQDRLAAFGTTLKGPQSATDCTHCGKSRVITLSLFHFTGNLTP